MMKRSGWLAMGLTIAGCAGDGVPAGVTVRDSAGVRIVENPAEPPGGERWSLASSHETEFGGADESVEGQLFRVRHAFRLSDDRIVVADPTGGTLKFFGPDGAYLESVGGSGEGPGEFERLGFAGRLPGDSIVTFDIGLLRATVFGPDGSYVRDYKLVRPDGSPAPASATGVFGDGSLLGTGFVDVGNRQPSGLERHRVPVFRFGPTGEQVADLGTFPTGEIYFVPIDNGFSVFPAPLARSVQFIAAGDRLYFTDSERYEIRVTTPDGEPTMIVRRALPPRPVSGDHMSAWREEQLERVGDPNRRREMARILEGMPVPETMPAYGQVRVDDVGHIWVEEYRAPGDAESSWVVFDEQGALRARVGLPDRFDPIQIGEDFVLGVWRDPFDVEHLRLHRLSR